MENIEAPRTTTFREPVFWLVFCGLMVIGLQVVGLHWFVLSDHSRDDRVTQLLQAGRMVAATIDGNLHSSLDSDAKVSSPAFAVIKKQVQTSAKPLGPADLAYTVRKASNGEMFVVVSSAGGPVAFTPVDHPSVALQRCFGLGASSAGWFKEDKRQESRQESCTPITDDKGSVVGVLVLQVNGVAAPNGLGENAGWLIPVLVVTVATSLAVAWILSSWIREGKAGMFKILRTRIGRMLLEATVASAVIAALAQVFLHSMNHDGTRINHREAAGQIRDYGDALALVNQLSSGATIDVQALQAQELRMNKKGLGWVSQEIEAIRTQPGQAAESARANLLAVRLTNMINQSNERLSKAAVNEDEQEDDVVRVVLIAALVGVTALSLVRVTRSQERHLIELTIERKELLARFQHVVEGLPVGLFIFQKGNIVFTNQEWDSLFSRRSHELAMERLRSAIHPDDQAKVLEALNGAEANGQPFETSFRIRDDRGGTMHIQSRGTPVMDDTGRCQQILAFTLDVTSIIDAKSTLERTNSEVEQKNRMLSAALGELEANLENVVRALVRAVEAKDPYTAGHSERVKQYSLWLGKAVGLSAFELRILELGCLVHDIGKIGTPDAVLTKPGRLSDEEFDIIKMHPTFGVKILESIGLFRDCLPIVRWHHEKLNGAGYPDGISGSQVPYLVRIATIADIYDAMTSTRAYRRGMASDAVLRLMNEMVDAGDLDAGLFATFSRVIAEKGVIEQEIDQDVA